MQLPAIKTAKEMGWRVILADGNPQVPGRSRADYFEHVDLKDKELMFERARFHRENGGLDGVFTAGTDFSATVAWVAGKLDLPGIPYESALKASRKGKMRRAFALARVPIPGFVVLDNDQEPLEHLGELSFPLVIKPVDNMGSRGIRRVDSREELMDAFALAGKYSRSGKVILEEFIEGPEFSLDALVEKGRITICGFADRHIFFSPYFIEMGHTIPTNLEPSVRDEIEEVFRDGIRALGITSGAAKGDIKLSPKGPVVGEIAARLSGGFMSGWTFPFSSGVNVTRGALNLAVGLPPGDLDPLRNDVSAERACISIPGKAELLRGVDEARKLSGIEFIHINTMTGERVCFPRNNVEKCGNFISRARERDTAAGIAETAAGMIEIVLEPGNDETEAFLLQKEYSWVPMAYTLTDRENLRILKKLPLISRKNRGKTDKVTIAPLAALDMEKGCDWNGISIDSALTRVFKETGAGFGSDDEWYLGRIFWSVFLRGGYQGAVWFIRTLERINSADIREEFINKWTE